eukprot:TRINITY_DN1573_c0_g3_i1.p1 TRINITY_DN1573_c0_g3~~TRINITY_DN1573_c0_g3_i1.p1  ORF type:complete len:689 (+),score=252.61 TRINITY_DN1573_c0_g3_i1:90-2069(+)
MPTASDAEPPPVASDHQGESDGRKAWGTDQRTGVPEGGGGHHLSASAPAFVQRPKPHVVSVFNPIDYSTAQLHCNLASCMVQELRQCASAQFGIAPECFDLLHNGQLLGTDPALKAIDAGLGNGAVVVLQVKGTGPGLVMPPAPMGMMRGQLMPQHMTMYQMMGQMGMPGMPGQLFAPGSSPPLTPVGGSPAPSPLHASAGLPVQMGASIDTIPQTRHAPHHQQAPPQSGAAHPTDSLSSLPSSRSTAGRSLPPSRGASPRGAPGDGFASGEFCTYALSSDGSRSLIHALQALADPQDTVAQLLPVLRPKFANLAMHQHASKVLAALAAIASPQQVAELIRIASPDICEIAEANAGSEVLCALAARLPASDAAAAFVEAAVPRIVPLATSVNGRKVLQAALLKLSYDEACPLYDAVCFHIMTLATDQCGCITVQRLYDAASDHRFRMQLQMRVLESTIHLITDPYGNYVLQHAIKDVPMCSEFVAQQVAGNVAHLACNKYASNVLERCLQSGTDEVRCALILEICQAQTVAILMNDAFGNYVVQSAVDTAPNSMLDMLKDAISPLTTSSPYGYRIETKLKRRLKRTGRGLGRNGRDSGGRRQPQRCQPQLDMATMMAPDLGWAQPAGGLNILAALQGGAMVPPPLGMDMQCIGEEAVAY